MTFINRAFAKSKTSWDISITKKDLDAGTIAKSLIGKTELAVVYGGDGSVTEVAAALYGTQLPLAILPGGTANVMAKELGIPLETETMLALLQKGKFNLKAVDMGLVNGHPFLLRVNLGIMAAMITSADRGLKNKLGQLAYGVTAIKTMSNAEPVNYQLEIDGRKHSVSGVALTVTNSGNMGIGSFELQPGISITDGLLDVILLPDTTISSVLQVAGSALMQNKSEILQHWTGRKITLILPAKQSFICDDTERFAKTLKIEVVPGAIQMVVPTLTK